MKILTYHRVGPPRSGRYEKLTVLPRRFSFQLGTMRRLGFSFCGMDEAAHLDTPTAPRRRCVVLTFDDGYADLSEYVFPELETRGIPAVVFAVTDRQVANWMDWGELDPLPLLTRTQLKEAAERGIEIASHTRTHARLTECSPSQLKHEVEGSKKILEDLLGREVRHFCYPYGAFNEKVIDAVREAGYHTACTTLKGVARTGADAFALPRLTIGKRMGSFRFLRRLLTAHRHANTLR